MMMIMMALGRRSTRRTTALAAFALLTFCLTIHGGQAFAPAPHKSNHHVGTFQRRSRDSSSGTALFLLHDDKKESFETTSESSLFDDDNDKVKHEHKQHQTSATTRGGSWLSSALLPWLEQTTKTTAIAAALFVSVLTSTTTNNMAAWATTSTTSADSTKIVSCLFQKCSLPLGKCILNPRCLANVACINTCTGRPDEINCQIECGNLFENDVVGEFNKCAISDMSCVPRQEDDGSYPVPAASQVVPSFDTKFFNGQWYITAGQNPLFDVFPCQVHFFTETAPGQFFGKLNWRIQEPDGEFFNRDALQEFVQDVNMPAHLVNDNNEYLHYSDDWWIIDYEYDDNKDGVPPFAFVYYRGSNDAWDGYGGVVVYTRDAALPTSLLPRLRAAAAKVNFDFDKDFVITDNSCPAALDQGQKLLLREQFAGKVALQTEQQLQAQMTRFRGTAANSIKAQKLYFANQLESAEKAFGLLNSKQAAFEQQATTSAAAATSTTTTTETNAASTTVDVSTTTSQ